MCSWWGIAESPTRIREQDDKDIYTGDERKNAFEDGT
jgi:hypothetical protein